MIFINALLFNFLSLISSDDDIVTTVKKIRGRSAFTLYLSLILQHGLSCIVH